MTSYTFCAWLFFIITQAASAQSFQKYKSGKIDPADLKMTIYSGDSTAKAVILYDYNEVSFTQRLTQQRYHYVRIKILKTSALDYANVVIDYYGGIDETLRDVSASVHNLNADGTESVQKLDNKNIFNQALDEDLSEAKFSIPGVKVGSVIEYSYRIFSEDYSIPDFSFQSAIPTREADLYFSIPDFFKINTVWNGDCYNNQVETTSGTFTFMMDGSLKSTSCEVKHIHINATPAYVDEPFSGAAQEYVCRFGFVLTNIYFDDQMLYTIPTWADENADLLKKYFTNRQLDGSGIINQKAEQLVGHISDTMQKIKTIYSFVRDSFAWNNKHRFYSSGNLNGIFKDKSGNSADINLILILMLRHAGISSYPVLTSTAGFGSIKTAYAIPNQFNDLLCMVTKDTSSFFLDATDPENPFCFIDKTMLNRAGFVVDPGRANFVALNTALKSQRATVVNANLTGDGSIKGTAKIYDQGYYAIARREDLKNYDKKKFLDAYGFTDPSTQIDSFSVINQKNPDANLTAAINFSGDGYASPSGDKMYVKPVIFPFFHENPFKSEQRILPVDFSFQRNYTYQASLTIPDGYSVAELPENKVVKMPDGSGQIKRIFSASGNTLSMIYILTMSRTLYSLAEYTIIRQFFDSYLSLGDELVVLQKKS